MSPLPKALAEMAAKQIKAPTAARANALIIGLVSYVSTQYARCQESKPRP